MKTLSSVFAILLLPVGVQAQAAPDDRALCQGDYPVVLMTERECSQYVSRLRAAQQGGDTRAQSALVVEHDALLNERATACRCVVAAVAGDC